jgi:probable F420-dependent oxidoreductase
MSGLSLGPVGMTLEMSADGGHLAQAAALEELGYTAIWLRGGQIDSLARIAEVVAATSTVPVVPGIIPLGVYPPGDVLRLAADLEASAPGRFVAGLGGPQVPRPLGPLNDYLDELDHGSPPLPAGRRILAALGPRKLEIARERAAGAVLNLVTPEYTRTARRLLGDQATLVVGLSVAMGSDTARAREGARTTLRFLAGVNGYRTSFVRMGFAAADIADLSDDLVDRLVAVGDLDAVTARIQEHLRAGADHVALHVLTEPEGRTGFDTARQLAARLGTWQGIRQGIRQGIWQESRARTHGVGADEAHARGLS